MIDLNMKRNQDSGSGMQKEDETPIGVVILGVMPFVLGFWWILTQALLCGK